MNSSMLLDLFVLLSNIVLGFYFLGQGTNRIITYKNDPEKQAAFIQNRGRFFKNLGIAFLAFASLKMILFLNR